MITRAAPRWIAACALICAAALPPAGVEGAAEPTVDGTWIIRDLVLHIFTCQSKVCGRIVWLRDATRRPSQCGKTIVWGLEPSGPNAWSGGAILDPDDNKIYRLSATLESDGTLRARIFKGIPIFGATEVLKRVDIKSFAGQC